MSSTNLVQDYFNAFNAGDSERMLTCLAEDVQHHPNEGTPRHGIDAFRAFLGEMDRAYREEARDLVLFDGPEGRVAAEFLIHGSYLETQEGLPEATGQTYVLSVGSFFAIRDGRIARVTTYYNLSDWLRQVGA